MSLYFSDKIKKLSKKLNKPLYAVGGYVRNYLINGSLSNDIDLASATDYDTLLVLLKEGGFTVQCEYKRTGTIVFSDEEGRYEFTAFRKDFYSAGGSHAPTEVDFTDDIKEDALRRDFKCNAIYYDIEKEQIVDPLGGLEDIKNKVLDTVKEAREVFSHDGLRLMRLARFCGELNFKPTKEVMLSASRYASNIKEIASERIFAELKMILSSDSKYVFSNKQGHYTGLKVLSETGVLDYIIPELTLGRGMKQREDYHDYDVLEHSLKCVLYADKSVRLSALLHDVGKPYCMINEGKYHMHAIEGEKIAKKILSRLKASAKEIKETTYLVKAHMLDIKEDMKEGKIRLHIVKNVEYFDKLMALKQADFSACKDDLSCCPTVKKWQSIYSKMKLDGTPFTLKELKITANEIMEIGIKGSKIGDTLNFLFLESVLNPKLNERQKLLEMAGSFAKKG